MKIGFFTANYLDTPLDKLLPALVDLGYEAVELPAFSGSPHCDVEKLVSEPEKAKEVRKFIENHGLTISALSNHPEGQLIMGPHGKDTDTIYPGSAEEKVRFGMERMIKTAQAANALEVPVVCGFVGCENFGRFFPWPYGKGWSEMEETFAERWGKVLAKYDEYGVKFGHEPHPNEMVYDIWTAQRSLELLKDYSSWGFNFDPANLVYLGIDVECFIQEFGNRIWHVHAKDGELVSHNVKRDGTIPTGPWTRIDRGFRFRIPGWGSVPWKKVITELAMVGYDYVLSYEHEDVTMSRDDGAEKTIDYLRPLVIKAPYEGRKDILFQ